MLNFEIKNATLLQNHARKIISMKTNKAKNQGKFAALFENLLKDPTFKSLMALSGDIFKFENNFDPKENIHLPKEFGVKGGRFVSFISNTPPVIANAPVVKAETFTSNTAQVTNSAFANNPFFGSAQQAATASVTVTPEETDKSNLLTLKSQKILPEKLAEFILNYTFNIEHVYDTWISQLIEYGNKIAEQYADVEISDDIYEEDPLNEQASDEDDSAFAVDDDVAVEKASVQNAKPESTVEVVVDADEDWELV